MSRRRLACCLALLTLGGLSTASAGQAEADRLPLDEVQRWQAPDFDHRAAAAEPIVKGRAVDVGRPFPLDVTTEAAGTWEALKDGARLWRLRVASPEALWLVLGFDRFGLQSGATLSVIAQGGKHVQTYTADDVQPHGQLWTAPAPGDELVIELHWPAKRAGENPALHLAWVSHGFRPFGVIGRDPVAKGFGDSGACNIDVACPAADGWRDEIRGAMLILRNGAAACSGSLINNTAEDCKNYVLTANHCFTPANAPSLTFQFNFERPGCNSGNPGPAQIVTGGATFRAASASTDFYLAEMLGNFPPAVLPYYNGWSRSSVAGTESTGIHHPAGDAKKISFNTDPLVSNGSYWRVTEWEQGTTEGGSSGSPLFDQNQLIVGQLFGGFASCFATDEWDEYGKLSLSWNGDGTSSTRLRDWLDPVASNVTTLAGRDVGQCAGTPAIVQLEQSDVDDAAGNADGVIDPGERLVLTAVAANNGGQDATQVTGTLATSTAGVTITRAQALFPDLASGASAGSLAPHFELEVDADFDCGDPIDLTLTLDAAEASFPSQNPIRLDTGLAEVTLDLEDDLEAGTANWTIQSTQGTSSWTVTTVDSFSPTRSWFVADTSARNDQLLLLDPFPALGPGRELVFMHRYNTEATWDGGVLEYSVEGGSWLDAGGLITQGGYTSAINGNASSNLAGRAAWSGSNNGWTEVRVDLSTRVGDDVQFRWRLATDTSVPGEGWYVDDVQLVAVDHVCGALAPGEAAGPDSSSRFHIDPTSIATQFSLTWSAPAAGATPDGYRLYGTPIGGAYAPTCVGDLGSGTLWIGGLPDDTAFLVVAYNPAGEGPYGADSSGTERPPATGPDVCP